MRVFSLLLLIAASGCPGGGTPARAVQPGVPDVGTADPSMKPPSLEACKPGSRHDVMVIDWKPEQRGDLEVAMKEGLAVLQYDCKTVRIVPCSVEGSYNFIGTTRREKKIELNDADEIAANLPVGGLTWLSDVSGKVDRERALLAQLIMIGKRSSARKQLAATDLAGCDGATHYVRAVTLGAFAVAAGSKAELAASLSLVGKGMKGESKSSTKIASTDGDLAACEKANPESTTPPAQCGALVRVELEPIGAPVAVAEAPATCAPGFAMSEGRCVRTSKPHACRPGDAGDCAKQCDAGDPQSCATLAIMHRDGNGVAKDWGKATALAQKACDKDVVAGCRVVGAAKLTGQGTSKDAAGGLALLARACDAGDGMGCVELGNAKLADRNKQTQGEAQYAFRRACYGGGEVEGCTSIGRLYVEGKAEVSKNPKLATQFFEKACKDGSAAGCFELAEVTKDQAKAKGFYEKACNGGHAPACKKK